jgi:hypothetical protein
MEGSNPWKEHERIIMGESLADLMREIREAVNFVVELPRKIVNSFMGARSDYQGWKQRIEAQKRNAEMREIAKCLQGLYFRKADISAYVASPEFKNDDKDVEILKGTFSEAAENLQTLRQMLIEIGPTHPLLITDAPVLIASASRAYQTIAKLPDSEFRSDRAALSDLCRNLDALTEAGNSLLKRLDDERQMLDYTY